MTEITRVQPAVVKVLCEDDSAYDLHLFSYEFDAVSLRAVVDEELDSLYLTEDSGEIKTIDEAIQNLSRRSIYLLQYEQANNTF